MTLADTNPLLARPSWVDAFLSITEPWPDQGDDDAEDDESYPDGDQVVVPISAPSRAA